MKRADEEFCKVQFDTFIKQFFTPPEVTWADKLKGVGEPRILVFSDECRFADRQMYEDCVHRFRRLLISTLYS